MAESVAGVGANRASSLAGAAVDQEPHGARIERITPSRPIDFAQLPLFGPIADLMRAAARLPDSGTLNRWVEQQRARREPSPQAAAVRFVAPDDEPLHYEARIHARRQIVTRPDNWHDFFNALVWLRFPRTKTALNDTHVRFMRVDGSSGGRGSVRDAVTQFDESGVIVASTDPSLLEVLSRRRWKDLFWTRRAEVMANMRFLVFGHGLYDALRAPFYCICGRAALVSVDRATFTRDAVSLCDAIDPLLAARFATDYYPRPRALLALPLLGIPGVIADNESPRYYDDEVQFRPPPAWSEAGA